MRRRDFLKVGAVLTASASLPLVGCGSDTDDQVVNPAALEWDQSRLSIAQFKDATETVWQVAEHLHAQGLGSEPPLRHFVADADEAHVLALSGTLVGMSFDDVIDVSLSGHAKAGQVTSFYGVHRGFLSLMAAPTVNRIEDLRGLDVAVDTYSGYASALFEILERSGLNYQTDLNVVLAGATNVRFTSLLAGDFTATLLGSPFDILAQDQNFNDLTRVIQALGGYQGVVFAAHRDWLSRHTDQARALTATFANALSWAAQAANRPALRNIISASLPVPAAEAVVDAIADRLFGADSDFCPPHTLSAEDLAQVLTLFAKYREVDLSDFDLSGVVDSRFVTLT